jgi:outer membrane protein assembly factor BamB
MNMIGRMFFFSVVALAGQFTGALAAESPANDWPSWRGPEQTGMTRENAVVTSWSLDGQNVLWKVPVGGRSTPIVMKGRVYAITPVGSGECLQERVICLDADTGKTIWEHRFNAFHTDIVENRLGWTSVVGDPATGNIYAHGTGGEFFCFSRDGEVLWKHSLAEELGRSSGYGGRLHTPIIDEDRVVISMVYILTRWGTGPKKAGHRYFAFDKRTGEVLWAAQPGGRPLDTTYSVPVVTVIGGKRMLIAGNADGGVYGMSARTGSDVWAFHLSKRGINSSIVTSGNYAYVMHSEENLEGTEMGSVVCLNASGSGDLAERGIVWRHDGLTVGYSSPAVANGRLYVVSNSANLMCFDAGTGKQHWEHSLGRAMKGSPVVTADGVIYAGEVNGRFLILRDAGDHCETLDITEFPKRGDAAVEINGSPAVANGRVYFMNAFDMYCLGDKTHEAQPVDIPPMSAELPPDPSKPAVLQVIPGEVTLAPGERLTFQTRLFDVNRRRIGSTAAQWSVDGVAGAFEKPGTFVATTENLFSAGLIRARAGDLTAEARVRISPKLPIHETFDRMPVGKQPPGWIGLDAKTKLVRRDGGIVLQKLALKPSAKYTRMRSYSGPPIPTGYTVEADLLGSPKQGRRPTLSDMGLINARYKMILLGYEKRIRLVSYSPIPRVQEEVPYDWQPDVWYRAKFSVDLVDGRGVARAKVWPRDGEEPADWMIEMVDPCPNLEGSPGLYAYSKGTTAGKPGAPVFFDNYRVYRNDE